MIDARCKSVEVDDLQWREWRDMCQDEDYIGWKTVKRRGQRGKTSKITEVATGEDRNEHAADNRLTVFMRSYFTFPRISS